MKSFLSRETKLTTKQLLITIVILLIVLASPVIISASDYISSGASKLGVYAKESFCAREYPERTVKALTAVEFTEFVAKKVATGSYASYTQLNKYQGMSETAIVRRVFNRQLRDTQIDRASYEADQDICYQITSNGPWYYVGAIPWYYF
ncbi:MAG: hypothetical protein HRU04_13000 [Oceanospirillaceae bacterium]|nr:hypothetical protein [Oceanospirillaceae bacterium]